jgi:hypothetical protein
MFYALLQKCKNRSVFITCMNDKRMYKNFAKTVFDTQDLVRLIYSFGYPEHRVLTQYIAQEIREDVHEITYERLYWIESMTPDRREGDISLTRFLEEVPMDLLKLLNGYKRCYCCQRHNKNKPIIHEGQIHTFKGVVTERNAYPCDCGCPCRHYSRYFMKHLFD